MSLATERADRAGRVAAPPAAWAAWALAGVAAAAAWVVLRSASLESPETICLLRRVAHVSCPTCGLTRSLALLARGDLAGSLAMHPWGVALVAQLAAAWAICGLWAAGRLRRRPDRWLPHAVAANAAALAALWVARLASGLLP